MSDAMAGSGDVLEIQVLGGFGVRAGGQLVLDGSWNRRKALELLKVLAIQPNGSLPRERLLDTVWPDLSPEAAGANLRKNLHYLRVAFRAAGVAEPVTVQGAGLALISHGAIDLRTFRVAAAEALRQRTSVAAYDDALAIYAGDLLPEDLYQDWADVPRQQLSGLRMRLLEHVSHLHALRGEYAHAQRRVEQLLDIDGANERGHRFLMTLHAMTGDRDRALRQFELCEQTLRRDLTVAPSAETVRLREQIIAGTVRPAWSPSALVARPFVGREAETTTARAMVGDMFRGRGGVLLLEGEAGIGKSRLAAETIAYADLGGARALRGHCSEDESAHAYWPWLQILRSYTETAGIDATRSLAGDDTSTIARLLPELTERPPAGTLSPDADQSRFQLFDAIASFLRNAARRQPLVLLLDDVHAADPASLALLEFLSNDIEANRMLVICTYRPWEATENARLTRTLALLQRRFRGCRLEIGGLSHADVERLIEVTAELRPPEELVSTIWEESEGNPFFVEEITRLLISEGRLTMGREGGMHLPQTVRDLMARRFASLSPAASQLLRTAAVVGRAFPLDVLTRITNHSIDEIVGLLEEAQAAHLIAEVRFGEYTFSHPLVREALYLDLGQTRRALLHQSVGQALEAIHHDDLPPHLAQLAHHYFAAIPAAEPALAIAFALRAADQATAQAAFEGAVRLLRLALRAQEIGDATASEALCQIHLSLGRAQARAGDTPDAKGSYERAATLARDAGVHELFCRAAVGYEDATLTEDWVPSEYEPAVQLLWEADSLEATEISLRALVRARLARAMFFAGGEHNEAKALALEAVRLARQGNVGAQVAALEAVHWTSGAPEEHAGRRAAAESMLVLAEQSTDATLAFKARSWLMVDLLECGDIEGFDAHLTAINDLAAELRQPVYRWNVLCLEATRAHLAGSLVEAERLATEALAIGQRAKTAWALQAYGALVGGIRLQQGRLSELEPAIRALHEQYPEGMAWRSSLVFTQAYLGMLDQARAGFETLAEENFAGVKHDGSWLITACVIAETAHMLDDRERAAILYDMLLPHAALHSVAGNGWSYGGSVEHFLGLLAATTRAWQTAATHFGAAIAIHERIGSPPYAARSQFAYAKMQLDRGPSHRASALILLEQASAVARNLGLADLTEKASVLMGARTE